MYQIDNQSRFPVYEQIVDQIEKYVLSGVLQANEQIPSVRKLSLELNINPNTTQKAFTELERKKIIYTIIGKGSFISEKAIDIIKDSKKEKLTDLKPLIQELAISGVELKEIVSLVEDIYRRENK